MDRKLINWIANVGTGATLKTIVIHYFLLIFYLFFSLLSFLEEEDVVHKALVFNGKLNKEVEQKLRDLSLLIENVIPCNAEHEFQILNQGVVKVRCETVKDKHKSGHVSPATYYPAEILSDSKINSTVEASKKVFMK